MTDWNGTPPHSIESEQQLIGAILENNDRLAKISDIIDEASFHDPVHGKIYERIRSRIDAGSHASPAGISNDMRAEPGLRELGGYKYLATLYTSVISGDLLRGHAQDIADLKSRRDLLTEIEDAKLKILLQTESTAEIASKLEGASSRITEVSSIKPLIRTHLHAATAAVRQINDAYKGDAAAVGVSTGIAALDRKLSYLRPGNLIILAGRPAMGKTTIAQNFAFNAATGSDSHAPVGVFYGSLEMTAEDMATRFLSLGLANRGERISYSKMVRGDLTEDQMRAAAMEAKAQESLPLILGERNVREVAKLRSAVKRAKHRLDDSAAPLGLVVVDYLQMLQCDSAKSIYDRASIASDACKDIAMDLGIPVIGLAQLNRGVESRDPAIPVLSDLRDSGKLEEDADAVIFAYRDEYYLEQKIEAANSTNTSLDAMADLQSILERKRGALDMIVAKQRSGPTGTVRAYADLACCRIMEERAARTDGFL